MKTTDLFDNYVPDMYTMTAKLSNGQIITKSSTSLIMIKYDARELIQVGDVASIAIVCAEGETRFSYTATLTLV